MERWQDKVAVVTGASSGVGAQIASDLIKTGLKVVALSRQEGLLEENQEALPEEFQDQYYPWKCDVADTEHVRIIFDWIDERFGGVDILIHCASASYMGVNLTGLKNGSKIKEIVDTNVMGVVHCVQAAFNSMKIRNCDGHIVIVNCVLGHFMPTSMDYPMNIYTATKHAVTAMVETYRQEFTRAETRVKVTSISPGTVEKDCLVDPDSHLKVGKPMLKAEDVSNAIIYTLSTQPHVQVHEIIIRPLGE